MERVRFYTHLIPFKQYLRRVTNLEIIDHTTKVQSIGGLVKVTVLLDLHTRVTEDWDVVTPGRVGEEDLLGMGIPLAQESSTNTKSSSSRDGLGDSQLECR